MAEKQDELFSLEQTFDDLEKVVSKLESDEISLEDSFSTYKQGMEMIEKCNAYIDFIEKKVQVLGKDSENESKGSLDEF